MQSVSVLAVESMLYVGFKDLSLQAVITCTR